MHLNTQDLHISPFPLYPFHLRSSHMCKPTKDVTFLCQVPSILTKTSYCMFLHYMGSDITNSETVLINLFKNIIHSSFLTLVSQTRQFNLLETGALCIFLGFKTIVLSFAASSCLHTYIICLVIEKFPSKNSVCIKTRPHFCFESLYVFLSLSPTPWHACFVVLEYITICLYVNKGLKILIEVT